jgi:ATPase subunit of ABC transporter with duplicated ATPase domains
LTKEYQQTKVNKRRGGGVMIHLKNVSKSFGGQVVLKNVNLAVFEREFIALVGRNGSGKTTLLKIMAGILEPDEGEVEMLNGLRVAYFPQEIPEEEQKKTGKELLAEEMGLALEKVVGEIGALLKKLRFPAKKLDSPIETLSDGEKSKLLLMAILSSNADIFLLDEPTNNLDLHGLIVLENFIMSKSSGFIVVSHDRKFLDRLAVGVMEMDDQTHNVEIYHPFTYNAYLKERRRKEEKEWKLYESYEKERRRFLEAARKKKEKASRMARRPKKVRDKDKYVIGFKKDRARKVASQASSIEKRLEHLEEIKRPKRGLPLNLEFRFFERSGDVVFRLNKVEVKYDDFHFGPIDIEVTYGDRIVILGPNGEGKSTFLEILTGNRQPESGRVHIGSRVKVGYLPQKMIFGSQEKVLRYFLEKTGLDQANTRKTLARFGFCADDMSVKINSLSPGERSRFILATLMASEVNCLILDEPSNHLDPEALDRLEEALRQFTGTIIMVSHDRYFIDQVGATKTYLIEHGRLDILRDYHEYENKVLSGGN